MIYTLVVGAPVRNGDRNLGTLSRILVNNGICNQFVVSPGGLFGGPERIVPINDVIEATEHGVTLEIADDDWKSYSAFSIDQLVVSDQAAAPSLVQTGPTTEITAEMASNPTADAADQTRTTSGDAVVLTGKTRVGDDRHFRGLVMDTGIPQRILIEGGEAVPIDAVAVLDENHIRLGETPPRLDGATAPGGMGGEPPRVQ